MTNFCVTQNPFFGIALHEQLELLSDCYSIANIRIHYVHKKHDLLRDADSRLVTRARCPNYLSGDVLQMSYRFLGTQSTVLTSQEVERGKQTFCISPTAHRWLSQ